jgi:uncharacterized protein (TIGR03437 family)
MEMSRNCLVLFLCLIPFVDVAVCQSPDFLHPQQKGPFQINGLGYSELPVMGPQTGYTDPVNLGTGYSVPTLDQSIAEIKATGATLVKFAVGMQVKNYTDNAYDPAIPFPLEGKSSNVLAFGRKLTAQGISCLFQPFSGVANIIAGAGDTSRILPTDRRVFMIQHIPYVVTLARLAEDMGCEYFQIVGDEIEHLTTDPSLTDLWVQAITQVRAVFSGRLLIQSSWGEHGGPYTFLYPPQIISRLDIFGFGFFPAFTDHADPTVAELVASYQRNSAGHNSVQAVSDIHAIYGKPVLIADLSFPSFKGSNVLSNSALFGQNSRSQFTVDYEEQRNLYTAFFQVMPTLNPSWMLGAVLNNFDRLPYAWKDVYLPPYLGSLGEGIRGKPAQQTVTEAFQASRPQITPANGWWYNPATPGSFYAVEAENGVVRLGSLTYSTQGDPQWHLVRAVQTVSGTYVGTMEQYRGGRALNQPATPPAGIVDGPAVSLVFTSAATATLQIGTQSTPIQRYQFSDQWSTPMLNAPRAGWWDQTSQSGRGYFLEVQGNTLFLGGLIYTTSGQPTWFTSTGPIDSTGAFSSTLTVCSTSSTLQSSVCRPTADSIRLVFSAPWRATLTLAQEPAVEIRRYRQSEIGWAGPTPSFSANTPSYIGESATVNAASFAIGVAPGAIATIFGTGLTRGVSGIIQASTIPLPYSLQGTSVLVNGVPAPIFAIANVNGQEQINFQVPWGIQGAPIPRELTTPFITTSKPVVSIVVVNNGVSSPPMRAYFYDVQPGIITSDGTHAVALFPDNSVVTNEHPARPGDILTLYGVGFGPTSFIPPTGTAAGSAPLSEISPKPSFGIGGRSGVVQFAGLSPGYVGLYQFNVVVPEGTGTGNLAAVFKVGDQTSSTFSVPVFVQARVQGELIVNGGFENPLGQEWLRSVQGSAAATFERTTSDVYDGSFSAHISVTVATLLNEVQFDQRNIPVTQGAKYQLQFWSKSSNARTMRVGLQKGGPDFHSYGLATGFSLGPTWQHYAVTFQATESALDGSLFLFLGEQTGEVWLDSVSLDGGRTVTRN